MMNRPSSCIHVAYLPSHHKEDHSAGDWLTDGGLDDDKSLRNGTSWGPAALSGFCTFSYTNQNSVKSRASITLRTIVSVATTNITTKICYKYVLTGTLWSKSILGRIIKVLGQAILLQFRFKSYPRDCVQMLQARHTRHPKQKQDVLV